MKFVINLIFFINSKIDSYTFVNYFENKMKNFKYFANFELENSI